MTIIFSLSRIYDLDKRSPYFYIAVEYAGNISKYLHEDYTVKIFRKFNLCDTLHLNEALIFIDNSVFMLLLMQRTEISPQKCSASSRSSHSFLLKMLHPILIYRIPH